MNLDLARSQGDYFIPATVGDMMGKFPRLPVQLKKQPDFFQVEEQHTREHRCTILPETDLDNAFDNGGKGVITAVTLVKRCLTTPDAIDRLKLLVGGNPKITYAGLKDRWAITAQRVTLQRADFQAIVRSCMPDSLTRPGFFIKDPVRTHAMLDIGHLVGNNFKLRVVLNKQQLNARRLEQYMQLHLSELETWNFRFPNAYGRQRLGKRQNLFGVGWDFIYDGPEAGIKRFLLETSPNETPAATQVRLRLAEQWRRAEAKAQTERRTVARQVTELKAMRAILVEMTTGHNPRPAYEAHNMIIEHRIINKLLHHLNYEETMKGLYKDFSLWVGAYQGFWFNQVLGKVLEGKSTLPWYKGEPCVPLFMCEDGAVEFYREHCPQAIPGRVHPLVRDMFLTPRQQYSHGPMRPAHREVRDLKYWCEANAVNLSFGLPKGSYATTFLSILFDVEGDQGLFAGN